jgi:hypothetical protein
MTMTRVGIVEWGARSRGAAALHRAVADALGRCIDGAAIGARYDLLDRARRHGWCAEEWTTVVPVLHDVEPSPQVPLDPAVGQALVDLGRDADGAVVLEAERAVVVQLEHLYETWREEATPIADAPYVHVVDRVVRELVAGAALIRGLPG